MTTRPEPDELDLPPELAVLDAELRAVAYEERPSFGPELEAELEREWARVRHRPAFPVRQLMAAGVAGLLMVGLGVPSARASLVKLLSTLQEPASQEVVTPPPPMGGTLLYEVPTDPVPDDLEPVSGGPGIPVPPPPAPEPEARSGYVGPAATLPRLLDRELLPGVVASSYPDELLAAGVGGTVRLLLWVDSTGVVDFVNVGRSSGRPALDHAALAVAPTFRFEPARRWGNPVGTWVEFDLVFEPAEAAARPSVSPAGAPEADPDTRPPGVR